MKYLPGSIVCSDQGPLAACFLNGYVLYILFVENVGAPWSSGAWGPGQNGPVVDPPLNAQLFVCCNYCKHHRLAYYCRPASSSKHDIYILDFLFYMMIVFYSFLILAVLYSSRPACIFVGLWRHGVRSYSDFILRYACD